MKNSNFSTNVRSASIKNKSFVCLGLDPDLSQMPSHLTSSNTPYFDFNKAIIEGTADIVCAYKPQIAHYSAFGRENELEKTISFIKTNYPDIPVILDSKRGDIGNTAHFYGVEAFERYGADALTLSPYLGFDSIEPFLKWEGKGLIILCKTSNRGSPLFQNLKTPDIELYLKVASEVKSWSAKGDFSIVVGATQPEILKVIRDIVGDMLFLVPGIGAQGGDLGLVMKEGISKAKSGDPSLMINSSRGIIYASSGEDFAEKAREACLSLREQINALI